MRIKALHTRGFYFCAMRDLIFSTFLKAGKVCTDSRNLDPDALFFCLRGERFNGNLFAQSALEAGCPLVVCDEDLGIQNDRLVLVDDSLRALQHLALDYRRLFRIPVLAITGSNGKTTTKELIRDVLLRRFNVHATSGNLNNHIGIPLTLLSMPRDTTFAVIEMGANHQREIASYCEYTEPDHGLITNIGKAHLEGFGGIEGVKKGKRELYDYLAAQRGVIFANIELPELREITAGMAIQEFGLHSGGQTLINVEDSEQLSFALQLDSGYRKDRIQTQLAGQYNLWNVAAAVAIGRYFGVDPDEIAHAISAYVPDNNRSQLTRTASNEVILDAYNANPTSMAYSLRSLASSKNRTPFFIVGDMRELGEEGPQEHRIILELAASLRLEGIAVGELFHSAGSAYPTFTTIEEAKAFLRDHPVSDRLILLKGSRAMKMESLLDNL